MTKEKNVGYYNDDNNNNNNNNNAKNIPFTGLKKGEKFIKLCGILRNKRENMIWNIILFIFSNSTLMIWFYFFGK